MLQFVTEADVSKFTMADWALARLENEDVQSLEELGNFSAYGVLKDGVPVCVVIYNWFRLLPHGNDMRVIIAADSPAWCLPGIVRELFRYPFEFAGCTRLTALIRDGNERSLKLCKGLGFKKEGVLRRAHNGRTNSIVLSMLREECKWLQPKVLSRRETADDGQEVNAFSTSARRPKGNSASAGRSKSRRPVRQRAAERDGPVHADRDGHVRA